MLFVSSLNILIMYLLCVLRQYLLYIIAGKRKCLLVQLNAV